MMEPMDKRYSVLDRNVTLDVKHLRSIFKRHHEKVVWAFDYIYENGKEGGPSNVRHKFYI